MQHRSLYSLLIDGMLIQLYEKIYRTIYSSFILQDKYPLIQKTEKSTKRNFI
jgi:hypothetical protein